jgi:hypothetical protein
MMKEDKTKKKVLERPSTLIGGREQAAQHQGGIYSLYVL